jgi:hypothetical protein
MDGVVTKFILVAMGKNFQELRKSNHALQRLRQEDLEFEASQGYWTKLSEKNTNNKLRATQYASGTQWRCPKQFRLLCTPGGISHLLQHSNQAVH